MIAWRGWLAVLGGILVHFTLGTLYTFGNMTPYLTSYIRKYSKPSELRYSETVWVFASAHCGLGLSVIVGGFIDKKVGPRLTTLIGGWLMSLGVLLTGIAVNVSFTLTVITYGLMFGLGVGIAYAPPLACAMRWMPDNKGLVNGLVVAGFGSGAFIFDQIQTAYLNPTNLAPDIPYKQDPTEKYFSQALILDEVPNCFFMLGAVYAVVQLFGCLLLFNLDDEDESTFLLTDETSTTHAGKILIGEPSINYEQKIPGIHTFLPSEMLRTRAFYTLWFTFLVNGFSVVFISTLYKIYGQTFIQDDHFLALVGAVAAIFNAGGRIFWGTLADRFSYRTAMLILCVSMIVVMMTLIGTQTGGEAMYFIWICLVFLVFSGNFSLLPTATAKAFGPEYVVINYGLLYTSQAITGPLGAILSTTLSDLFGWFGMFSLVSGFMFIGLILTFTFDAKKPVPIENEANCLSQNN